MTDDRTEEADQPDEASDSPHSSEAGGGPDLEELGGGGTGGLADSRPSNPDEAGTGPGGGA